MKYSSFAIIAAVFATGTLVSSSLTLAADKTVAPQAKVVSVSAPAKPVGELYAQAPVFNDGSATRLDGQILSASITAPSQAQSSEEQPAFNLMALVVAGLAVMGSLAFRRAPNK